MHVDVLLSAGIPPIMQVADPGAQGAEVAGMQGIGVNTPNAAAVADATIGLAMDMHMPKGGILTIGAKSMMLAAGAVAIVLLVGSTERTEGATPKVHVIIAPAVTNCDIVILVVEG